MSITHEPERASSPQTTAIRPCRSSDLESVAGMFGDAFPEADYRPDTLVDYLRQIYLESPWADEDIPSLVFEKDGRVEGFLGVVPRPFDSPNGPLRFASPSSLMVRVSESGKRNPIAGVRLLSHFLQGPQDFSITDTANDITRQLWTSLGGEAAHAYCYTWARPLRPLEAAIQLSGGMLPNVAKRVATPICRITDEALRRVRPFRPKRVEGVQVDDMDAAMHAELTVALPRGAIAPVYDEPSLRWLYNVASQSETEGELAKRVVRETNGKPLGWFVYYRTRLGIARVLQLAAFPRGMDRVFDCLLRDAYDAGAATLWGRTEPGYNELLTQKLCFFFGRPWVLVHSKDPDIVHRFQHADAFFSGLDGELWIKFNS